LKRFLRHAEGYLDLGLPQQALDALLRLGDLAKSDPQALYLLGEAYRALERYPEAVPPLETAVQAGLREVPVWLALGWCYKRTARLDRAVQTMEQALILEPHAALLHYNLACYLSLAGKKDRALEHLSRALELDAQYRHLVDSESDFDPIRSDPEFQALTKAVA